jgi:hypothetical protein
VAIKTVKTLDIKMPYPIEMKRLMGKWRCRDKPLPRTDASSVLAFDPGISAVKSPLTPSNVGLYIPFTVNAAQ